MRAILITLGLAILLIGGAIALGTNWTGTITLGKAPVGGVEIPKEVAITDYGCSNVNCIYGIGIPINKNISIQRYTAGSWVTTAGKKNTAKRLKTDKELQAEILLAVKEVVLKYSQTKPAPQPTYITGNGVITIK